MDELIIIGGSAAGISAGIYAARRNLKMRIIASDLGGEVAQSGEVENWPGIIHTTGIELAQMFENHIRSYEVPIEVGVTVTSVKKDGNHFIITATKDGQPVNYEAKSVIVATGVHPRTLNIPGEQEYKNKGVSYCTVCDGPLYRKKKVVTIGGGNSALESAIMLAGLAEHVTVINKNPEFKGEKVLIDKVSTLPNVTVVYNAQTKAITGEQFVTGVEYSDKQSDETQSIPADGVFVHIGMKPNSSFVEGVELVPTGEISVNKVCETNVPGLFAAGDVTDLPHNQIVIAAGQGVTACLQATRYLNNLPQD